MSNDYDFSDPAATQQGNVTVVVPPAATPPATPPSVPMATDDMINNFLGRSTAVTPSGGTPPPATAETYHQDPAGGNILTGVAKGASQQVLGALSLLPGIGEYFTRESWLGQRAYAPARGIGETAGEVVGSLAPWVAGGELLAGTQLSARTLGAIHDFSPALARVIGRAYGGGNIRVNNRFASRFNRPAAIAARGTVAGGVAGAVQEPAGTKKDATWLERLEARAAPAAAGAVTGGALGLAAPALQRGAAALAPALQGLTPAHQQVANTVMTSLGALVAHDVTGSLPLTVAAAYALHRAGLGVRAAHQLAPLIAQQAILMGRASSGVGAVVGPAGAAAGQLSNEIGRRAP